MFFPTFPFMKKRQQQQQNRKYTPRNWENEWLEILSKNGKGKTSEPQHQFLGFKMFVFPVGIFWGVRSVLDLSSGTYRKLIFKRMPGRSPLKWLPSVTFGLAGWLCLFPLSHSIPKGDVNISLVRFFRRTRAEGVFLPQKCVCVCVCSPLYVSISIFIY